MISFQLSKNSLKNHVLLLHVLKEEFGSFVEFLWLNQPQLFHNYLFWDLTRGLYSYMYSISLHTSHKIIGNHGLDLGRCLLGNTCSPVSTLSAMVPTFLSPSKGGHYEKRLDYNRPFYSSLD